MLVLRGAEHHSDNIKGTKIKYGGSVNVRVCECEWMRHVVKLICSCVSPVGSNLPPNIVEFQMFKTYRCNIHYRFPYLHLKLTYMNKIKKYRQVLFFLTLQINDSLAGPLGLRTNNFFPC